MHEKEKKIDDLLLSFKLMARFLISRGEMLLYTLTGKNALSAMRS